MKRDRTRREMVSDCLTGGGALGGIATVTTGRTATGTTTPSRYGRRTNWREPADVDPDAYRVLFDQSVERIRRVYLAGTRYDIYRYENYFEAVEGVEVFADGRRVTARGRVRDVATAARWQRAFENWPAPDAVAATLSAVRSVGRRATAINEELAPVRSVLRRILEFVRELQGRNLWRITTRAVEELETFVELVREVESAIDRWIDSSKQFEDTVPKLVEDVERIRRQSERNYRGLDVQFYREFGGRLRSVENDLGELVRLSNRLDDRFEEMTSTAEGLGDAIAGVSHLPDWIGTRARDLLDRLARSVEGAVEPVESFADRADDVRKSVRSLDAGGRVTPKGLVGGWKDRRTANRRLYAVLAVASLAVVVLAMEFWSMPLDEDEEVA